MVLGPLKEGVLPRDKFLTQSSSNSCRKLKRLVAESGRSFSQVTQNSTDHFKVPRYFKLNPETKQKENRLIGDHENHPGREGSWQKALLGIFFPLWIIGVLLGETPPKGEGPKGNVLDLCPDLVLIAETITGKPVVPGTSKAQEYISHLNTGRYQGNPLQALIISEQLVESQETLQAGQNMVNFFVDVGAWYSILSFSPGSSASLIPTFWGVSG